MSIVSLGGQVFSAPTLLSSTDVLPGAPAGANAGDTVPPVASHLPGLSAPSRPAGADRFPTAEHPAAWIEARRQEPSRRYGGRSSSSGSSSKTSSGHSKHKDASHSGRGGRTKPAPSSQRRRSSRADLGLPEMPVQFQQPLQVAVQAVRHAERPDGHLAVTDLTI